VRLTEHDALPESDIDPRFLVALALREDQPAVGKNFLRRSISSFLELSRELADVKLATGVAPYWRTEWM
jgi:hypothetical protein